MHTHDSSPVSISTCRKMGGFSEGAERNKSLIIYCGSDLPRQQWAFVSLQTHTLLSSLAGGVRSSASQLGFS